MFNGLIDESERAELDESSKYVIKKSAGSFEISDVESIVYGGASSRFWIFRKHINSMNIQDIKANKMPFYAWECITINLATGREVNIVVKNEACMRAFIMLLIYEMKTTDGRKDSGVGIIKTLLRQERRNHASNEQEQLLKVRHKMMMSTLKKYNLIKIRIKISYNSLVSR